MVPEIYQYGNGTRLSGVTSGVSMAHLPNLFASVLMEYQTSWSSRGIRLLGPNGSFWYDDGGSS